MIVDMLRESKDIINWKNYQEQMISLVRMIDWVQEVVVIMIASIMTTIITTTDAMSSVMNYLSQIQMNSVKIAIVVYSLFIWKNGYLCSYSWIQAWNYSYFSLYLS